MTDTTSGAAGASGARAVELRPYTRDLQPGIVDFNRRLEKGGVPPQFRLAADPVPSPFGDAEAHGVREERLIAVDGTVVRGGVYLQLQPFSVAGELHTVANVQLPLSEGIIDRQHTYLGMWLMKQVVRRYPRSFAIGMGGTELPLPQLLRAMGWSVSSIPFFFQLGDVGRAVRELPALGSNRRRRFASALLSGTGASLVAGAGWRAATTWRTRAAPRLAVHPVDVWTEWADALWAEACAQYAVIAVRDSRTLGALFPADGERFRPYRLEANGRTVGWVVVSVRRMQENTHFGNLVVGTIVDALTRPGYEVSAVVAATRLLWGCGAEVVVTNQSHPVWIDACRRALFRGARSNYALAASSKLVPRGVDVATYGVQFTRGDGDGRIHL